MINLLSQKTDSIPFILKRNVVASLDTIPISANEFHSYEYLSLDSSELFFDIDAISNEVVDLSGMEGVMRPFLDQIGGVIFLIFAVLFLFGAVVFMNNGFSSFLGIRSLFSFDNNKANLDKELVTTSDAWSNLFYFFQTYVIYSILFFIIAVRNSNDYYSNYDYQVLYLQILSGFILFVLAKHLFYRLIRSVISRTRMNNLIDTYFHVFNLVGIISFLPIIVYIYIPEATTYVLFFLSLLFVIGRIAVFIQSYQFFIKADIGGSYFFVYLCGVEIMPYLLLYKAIVLIN